MIGHQPLVTIQTLPVPAKFTPLHFYNLDHLALTICKDVE